MTQVFSFTSERETVRAHLETHGFALFDGFDAAGVARKLAPALSALLDLSPAGPLRPEEEEDVLGRGLMAVAARDRGAVAKVYDAAHTLPALFGLLDLPDVGAMLDLCGLRPALVGDLPRLRMDFPHEDKFLTVEHQEYTYYDCPASSVTLWFPLTPIDAAMGYLRVRPGSHKAGVLPVETLEERPYFRIRPGAWEDDYPAVDVPVAVGQALLFYNGLIHGSGLNRGDRPRMTVQLRYNQAADQDYRAAGWPRTFVVVARKDRDMARTFQPAGGNHERA